MPRSSALWMAALLSLWMPSTTATADGRRAGSLSDRETEKQEALRRNPRRRVDDVAPISLPPAPATGDLSGPVTGPLSATGPTGVGTGAELGSGTGTAGLSPTGSKLLDSGSDPRAVFGAEPPSPMATVPGGTGGSVPTAPEAVGHGALEDGPTAPADEETAPEPRPIAKSTAPRKGSSAKDATPEAFEEVPAARATEDDYALVNEYLNLPKTGEATMPPPMVVAAAERIARDEGTTEELRDALLELERNRASAVTAPDPGTPISPPTAYASPKAGSALAPSFVGTSSPLAKGSGAEAVSSSFRSPSSVGSMSYSLLPRNAGGAGGVAPRTADADPISFGRRVGRAARATMGRLLRALHRMRGPRAKPGLVSVGSVGPGTVERFRLPKAWSELFSKGVDEVEAAPGALFGIVGGAVLVFAISFAVAFRASRRRRLREQAP